MIKTLEKLLLGLFFFAVGKLIPDEYDSLTELVPLGGIGITSIYSLVKEYKTFNFQEIRNCWHRPLRIISQGLKTLVVSTFLALEIMKIESEDAEGDAAFMQGCLAGLAFVLLLESRTTWLAVQRRGEKMDKWDSLFSGLTSAALMTAAIGGITDTESGDAVKNISLITAGGICLLLQTPVRFKKEYSKLNDEIIEAKNLQGYPVPELYQPLYS